MSTPKFKTFTNLSNPRNTIAYRLQTSTFFLLLFLRFKIVCLATSFNVDEVSLLVTNNNKFEIDTRKPVVFFICVKIRETSIR